MVLFARDLAHDLGPCDGGQDNTPLTLRFFSGSDMPPPLPEVVIWVEADDIEEAEELPPPTIPPNRFEAVELVLFFFGSEGRTFPGSSVRRAL